MGSPLTINTSGGVPNSECSTTSVLASAAIAEEASVLAVSHVAVPVAHSCADRTTSNTLHHPWSIRNILCRLSGESNLKMYSFHISQLNNTSIKHDLARSCFQLWPKIGDEGDKISRKKNWRGASRDSFFSKFCHPRSRF